MERGSKKFHYESKTNGVRAAVLLKHLKRNEDGSLKNPNNVNESTSMNRIRQSYHNNEYRRVIGIDPGYKLWIAAVIRRKEKEINYRKSSAQFHHETGFFERKKRARKLDFFSGFDRTNEMYGQQPTHNRRHLTMNRDTSAARNILYKGKFVVLLIQMIFENQYYDEKKHEN